MSPPRKVAVVVLGDLGRSPRMQYHAASLAKLGACVGEVTMIGYSGERCFVEGASKLRERRIAPSAVNGRGRVYKALALIVYLTRCLLGQDYSVIVVQNPPALPVLLALLLVRLVSVFSFARRPRIVLDWHNLGFTMFTDAAPWLVALLRWAEKWAVRLVADEHLCVSQAMRAWLHLHFGLPQPTTTVLYDRPSALFAGPAAAQARLAERHDVLGRYRLVDADLFPQDAGPLLPAGATIQTTVSPSCGGGGLALRPLVGGGGGGEEAVPPVRPFLLVSSTSWTDDEDFGLLLDAAALLDKALAAGTGSGSGSGSDLARVVIVVTGKGPLRGEFEERAAAMRADGSLRRVAIRTLWLEAADYPRLLRCADLGVCLHKSTSGLDLPMKVLDMFGAGVPVLSYRYPSIGELVEEGVTGRLFATPQELCDGVLALRGGGPGARDGGEQAGLEALRRGVREQQRERGDWDANWGRVMPAVLARCGLH